MALSLKPLREQVMVITGASSGIGLAAAKAAAAEGARLVLAARNRETLEGITQEINREGGKAVHVVADVGRQEDVRRIADKARQQFGWFDTWVNDAGVSIFGRLDEVSDADSHRLFQTNFWGVVYGSLTAIEHLKKRGGALINLGSVASDVAIPLQGMYSASKHAVKGFTDALRTELEAENAPVSVTLIKPTSINTPFTHHARNYLDREPKLPPPVYEPEEVARAILHAATHVERDVYVGGAARMMSAMGHQAPRTMDRVGTMMAPMQRSDEMPRQPEGSLYEPGSNGQVHGDHPGYVMKTSAYTRAAIHPVLSSVLMAAAGVGVLTWLSGARR